MPAKQINNIEFRFTNTVPIDLKINFINLILETSEPTIVYLELFSLDQSKERSFIIPSESVDFLVKLGFVYDQLGSFKIIGYDLSLLNHQNNILFTDLIQNKFETNKIQNFSTSTQSSIESNYEIEMISKIPLIKQIILQSNELVVEIYSAELVSTPILNCHLGIW